MESDNAIKMAELEDEVTRLRTLVNQKDLEFGHKIAELEDKVTLMNQKDLEIGHKLAELEDKVTLIPSELASSYNPGISEMKKEFVDQNESVEKEVKILRELLASKCENTDTEIKRLSTEVSVIRTLVEQIKDSVALKDIQVKELASELANSRASFTCLPQQVGSKRPLEYGDPKKLFVGGIPNAVTEDKLKEAFSKYGTVKEHVIIRNLDTGLPRAFGFVIFEDAQVAEKLLVEGNVDIGGAMVEIKKAIPKQKPTIAPRPVFDGQFSTKGGRWCFD